MIDFKHRFPVYKPLHMPRSSFKFVSSTMRGARYGAYPRHSSRGRCSFSTKNTFTASHISPGISGRAHRGNSKLTRYKVENNVVRPQRNSSWVSETSLLRCSSGRPVAPSSRSVNTVTARRVTRRKLVQIHHHRHQSPAITSSEAVPAAGSPELGSSSSQQLETRVKPANTETPFSAASLIQKNNYTTVTAASLLRRTANKAARRPCPLYCRTGRCERFTAGQCAYLHDSALRPVCARLLSLGVCSSVSGGNVSGEMTDSGVCPFNHDPRREKLPVCVNFLQHECHNASCRLMHVRLDANAPLCHRFLSGFCPLADKCRHKHQYVCAEFKKRGRCSRPSGCIMAHIRLNQTHQSAAIGVNSSSVAVRTNNNRSQRSADVKTMTRYYDTGVQNKSDSSRTCSSACDGSFIRLAEDSSGGDDSGDSDCAPAHMSSFVALGD